jgi:hypothetical protein
MNLGRSLNRPLRRRLGAYPTRRTDGRRFRPPNNHFRIYLGALARYVRLLEKMAKREPHLYGPYADRYRRDTLEEVRFQAEMDAAICKVYGPPKPGDPPPRPDAWTQRYEIDPQWRGFRRWFRERYG